MAVDFEKLIKNMIVPLVVNPDDVLVKILGGKIANAMRTIVYAGASKENKRVHIDIDAF